ncbi:MAG: serine hydrolase [Azospirillaceae bacterium]|nr:serine hydrolase [Azospirillaceae bacterium]
MKSVLLATSLVCLLATAARAETPCGVPGDQPDGWATTAPASVGIDPALLCRLETRFAAWQEADIHAILVARHGKLVFERYYSGFDQRWGDPAVAVTFGPDVPHDLRSITKSVVSLLLGIGIAKGWIADVEQPVFSLLPHYADLRTPDKAAITLRDLLTMSAGLAWNEDLPYADPANSETRMDQAADPCRFVLEQPVVTTPGAVWNYSGGSAALIACALRQATGKPIDELARENLFEPLGITRVEWARYPQAGDPVAASGLRLRPRDTLKFGQLVLDKGAWQGRGVVPPAWIDAAVAPRINGPSAFFYGFQFWLGRSLVAGRAVDWIAGVGYGGQRLYIVPSLDLTVLVHAGLYTKAMQHWVGDAILNQFVLPATAP